MNDTTVVAARIPRDQAHRFRELAQQTETTMSRLLGLLVSGYLLRSTITLETDHDSDTA